MNSFDRLLSLSRYYVAFFGDEPLFDGKPFLARDYEDALDITSSTLLMDDFETDITMVSVKEYGKEEE